MSGITVTEIGRAVAFSALLPRSAAYFLDYFRGHRDELKELLNQRPSGDTLDGAEQAKLDSINADLAFIFFHVCYCSPEYGADGVDARRFIPYPLGERREIERALRLERYLAVRPWDRNALAVNAAWISTDWILGAPLAELEQRFRGLRGGMIREMLRTTASHMSGISDILAAAVGLGGQAMNREGLAWIDGDARKTLRQVVRRLRLYALQSIVGVPDGILWMLDVTSTDGQPLLRRSLALALREAGVSTIEALLDRGRTDELIAGLKKSGTGPEVVPRLRQAVQRVRLERTEGHKSRILRRLGDCGGLVEGYFLDRDTAFEDRLNACFECLKIPVKARDDEPRKRPRFPDFVIELSADTDVVLECKSSNGADISLGQATDVGAKAAAHGLNDKHMVTVCQQYVGSDVPRLIESAKNLSVLNAEDLAVALAYLKTGTITKERFLTWLTTPGQPQIEELFRR